MTGRTKKVLKVVLYQHNVLTQVERMQHRFKACNSFIYFKWRLYEKITLLINCINGYNYQSHFIRTGSLQQVMTFTCWDESCDW